MSRGVDHAAARRPASGESSRATLNNVSRFLSRDGDADVARGYGRRARRDRSRRAARRKSLPVGLPTRGSARDHLTSEILTVSTWIRPM
jgi:hypothetical protein